MGLFDMDMKTGVWDFRHKILAPLALIIILPIAIVLYAIIWFLVLILCMITGERSITIWCTDDKKEK